MDEEQQGPGVGLHRAGDVADDDELSLDPCARTEDAAERISTGPERLPDRQPKVELAAAVMAAQAARAARRPVGRELGDQLAHTLELGRGHRREVLRAQDLVGAVAALLV